MIDILALGPHPDDVEIGLGGTLALHARRGDSVVIADLTRGEMGSNGTPDVRLQEGEQAARILGARSRINLGLPDRGLGGPGHWGPDGAHLRRCVEVLRQYRPRVVAIPYGRDRHPDHVAANQLLTEAVFQAALLRYDTGQPPLAEIQTVFYFINDDCEPSFLVDITQTWQQKIESLFAHSSQFGPGAAGQTAASGGAADQTAAPTRLNRSHGLPYLVEARACYMGARIGVQYAEGFWLAAPPARPGLLEKRGDRE